MSQRMLDLLIAQWPGETHLTAEETAKVLKRNPYTVREQMRNGELPGAKKDGRIWKLPLPDLAEILEPASKAPQIPTPPKVLGGARRRGAVVMNFRRLQFWADVARALGDQETAETLDREAQAIYDQQVRDYLTERAIRRRALLSDVAHGARNPGTGNLE